VVTITQRPDGSYAVEMADGPRYLHLTFAQLANLIYAAVEAGMITVDKGRRVVVRR